MGYHRNMGDEESQRLYRLTIRSLYVAALVLNAWVLWDQVRDSPEGRALVARLQTLKDRMAEPVRQRAQFRKHANQVVFEAVTIVEGAEDDD